MDEGLYESVLTERLTAALAGRPDLHAEIDRVDDGEQPQALTRHLAPLIERSLRTAGSAAARAELLRNILAVLPDVDVSAEALYQREPGRIDRLDAVLKDAVTSVRLPRPAIPLADAALLTNARHEPTLAAELRAELGSADRVDLLCAFVKWQGLRLLAGSLKELQRRQVPLRVITSTYLGATDARALDALLARS